MLLTGIQYQIMEHEQIKIKFIKSTSSLLKKVHIASIDGVQCCYN